MSLITASDSHHKQVLENPDSMATTLVAVLLNKYGTECFDWDPKALRAQISEDFHAHIPAVNLDKIWALIVAMTTNQFFINTEIFLNTCKVLSGDEADFSMFRPVTPEELAWGVTEITLNNPPDQSRGNTEFSDEISSMVGMLLFEQGVLKAPKVLQFAIYPTENPVEDIQVMFEDDPEMFEAAMGNQKEQSDKVDGVVKSRLHELKKQLDSLGITPKNTAGAK